MKKYSWILTFLLGSSSLFAQQEIEVKSKVDEAIVFQRKAQVSRNASVNLPKGQSTLVFKGITSRIDLSSIQLKSNAALSVVSTKHYSDFLKEEEKPKDLVQLEDSLNFYQDKLSIRKSVENVLKHEKEMLDNNQKLSGNNQNLDVAQLAEFTDFYDDRYKKILIKLLEIRLSKEKLNRNISKLNNQISNLNSNSQFANGIIEIILSSKVQQTAKVKLTYVVHAAGWTPLYDVKVNDQSPEVDLTYKANIYQFTGNEWKDVQLTISTNDPSNVSKAPEEKGYYLNYNRPVQRSISANTELENKNDNTLINSSNSNTSVARSSNKLAQFSPITYPEETYGKSETRQLSSSSETFSLFKIDTKYTIPSEKNTMAVEISNFKLPSTFKHLAIPKLEEAAFLIARVTDWQSHNLISGNVNIFRKDNFLGTTFLNTSSQSDTLELSVGRDEQVKVQRKRVKEFTGTKVIGTVKKIHYGYEISIRNNKPSGINLTILDQLPKAINSSITVDKSEISNAIENERTGELKWSFYLPAGESKKLDLRFTVKHPKRKKIANL